MRSLLTRLRWRRRGADGRMSHRIGTAVALAGLLAGLTVVVTPGAAHAGAIVPCPAYDGRAIVDFRNGKFVWEYYRYHLLSVTPQFRVSDGRSLDNQTDAVAAYTISSSVSVAYQVTITYGIQAQFMNVLTTNVSTSVVASRTTQIGVSINISVPPRTRLIAEYGVDGYDVSSATSAWRTVNGRECEEWGWYPAQNFVPTVNEGWRLRYA
jgi:hypothetical protein